MLHRVRERAEAPSQIQRYRMRQKLFSFGNDFDIENEHGQKVFHVNGKVLRIRDTLIFEDMRGHELLKIQEKLVRVRDTMDIDRGNDVAARVHSALVTPLRDRYKIDIPGSQDLSAHGNILDHEYVIERGNLRVAEISKKWFRVADTYGVEVAPNQDDILLLAITVVIDMMSHEGR